MTAFSSMLILALAVSIDNFGTGLSYGLRKITIPTRSAIIIGLCAAISLSFGVFVGLLGAQFLNTSIAGKIGGLILIGIGSTAIWNAVKKEKLARPIHNKTLFYWEIKSINLVIEIMRKPLSADFDDSGSITGLEAIFLGLALSLDSFGVGISVALMHLSVLPLACCTFLMSSGLLKLGVTAGKLFSKFIRFQNFSFLPAIVLIGIGLFKIFI